MAVALGLAKTAQPAPQAEAAPVKTEAADLVVASTQEAAPVKAAIDSQATTDPVVSPAASWLDALAPEATKTEAAVASIWDDKAKNAFKETFGHEDPMAFKEQYTKTAQELELLKPELEPLRNIKKFIDGLPPALAEAMSLYQQGKDPIEYLVSLPKAAAFDRPVADVPARELIDHYFKGKVTPEDWNRLGDPDVDPAIKDAIKDKIGIYEGSARELYVRDLEKPKVAAQEREKAHREAQAAYDRSITDNVVAAKKSTVAPLIDQGTIDRFKNGDLVKKFLYLDDGVTIRPELLTDIVWAQNRIAVEERLRKSVSASAKSEGMAEATQRLPNGPLGSGRVVTQADAEKPDLARQIIARATGVKA